VFVQQVLVNTIPKQISSNEDINGGSGRPKQLEAREGDEVGGFFFSS
jgi:hypothetical protein